jgi:Tol biopolymer transport system component
VREWIGQVAKGKNPQMAFRELAHVSLTEVGDVWLREIRSIYWPELRERRYGKSIARQLTDHTQDQSNINMQPVLSPDGSKIAFFSDREPNVGLHIIDVEAEKVGKALSSAGSVKGHLSFYPYQSRITWSPDGTRLAFVSKTGDRDIISIINAKNGKSFDDVSPPDIRGILSPDWSPDGKTLVFNGIKDGRSDIFLWDLEKKKLSQLTNDIAVDQNPVFSPSGEWIAFDSDRNRPDLPQDSKRPFMALKMLGPMHDIYKIRTKGGTPIRILGGQFDERSPSYGPSDTEMVFLSNRSGISNIYIGTASDSGDWKSVPITNLTGSCYSPSWSRSGDRVAFSLFEDRGWDVYMMSSPKSHIISDSLPKTRFIRKIENPEMRFFNPLTVKNLSTFAKQRARSDSLRMSRTKAGRDSIAKKDSLIAKDSTLKRDTIALNPPPEPVTSSASLAPKPVPGIVDSASMKDSAALVNGTRKPSASDSGKPDSLASRSERLYSEWADTGQVDLSGETPRLGAFLAKPYKPKWGLEVAAADLGYNTFSRGLAGQTYLTVSDLLGNHRISFMISSGGTSLKSINGLINYDLLSYRTDYGFTAFNFANYQAVEGGFYYFDREYGGSVSARYPVSQFTRFQADINGFATERRLYDAIYGNMVPDSIFAPENLAFVQPSVSWIHDNAEYGIVGPLLGRRMKATISYVPPLFTDSISFIQADADFRKYWLFSKAFSLVARAAVGASEAVGGKTNPQLYLGGGDDLIPFVARTKPGNEPVTLPEVVFSQLAVPVRGFRFYEFRGNRKFISNLEFRFPFVETFRVVWPLPITLRYLMGTLFFDYGGAWQSPTNDNEFQAAIDGLGMGYGYGLRLNLGVFVLRYTNAWTVADVGPGRGGSRSYWSIGGEF